MRKYKIAILVLTLVCVACLLVACQLSFEEVDKNPTEVLKLSGSIGNFDLLAPTNGQSVETVPTFSWESASNAERYTLEVCSSDTFVQKDSAVYVKKTGISTTSFTIAASLRQKECTYYWRVTAYNSDTSKLCTSKVGSFYLAASNVSEVEFPIESAEDWQVHKEGSFATVAVDNSNFFNNGKSALSISFVEEDTNKGTEEAKTSDGWIVVTSTIEKDLYGVDAFFFNFYYSGDDATVLLRVIDDDNEYWHAPIKLSNNAKQVVIIDLDAFTLRTQGGTMVANQKFDYDHIKGVELVFEKTFGDGVCYISDLKAVNKANYGHLFLTEMDFSQYTDYVFENYNFQTTVEDDGKTLTLGYSNQPNEQNATKFNGYGFCKVVVNRLVPAHDAIKVKFTYGGRNNSAVSLVLRVYEEDGDRWSYVQPVSTLPEDGVVVIPYSAFALSEARGDGARQFYFIQQFQFGLQGEYGAGYVSFSDFELVDLADCIENLYQGTLSEDGTIENFDGYTTSAQLYYTWQNSTFNKDEQMSVDKLHVYGEGNIAYGTFKYKSDMFPAEYGVAFEGVEGFSAVSFWARDNSAKYDNAKFNYLADVSAKMVVTLFVCTGETYSYTIDALAKSWTNYTIAFADFKLDGIKEDATPLTSDVLAGFKFSLQYYYYDESGNPAPVYTSANQVFMDNIKLTADTQTSQKDVVQKLVPSAQDANICIVDDFENYTDESLLSTWRFGADLPYNKLAISNVSGNNCLAMQYQGNTSVNYYLPTVFDSAVVGKAISLKICGDGKATVYVNIYFTYADVTYKYRATITKAAEGWNEYLIGFSNFVKVEGSGNKTLSSDVVSGITRISFGIVNGTSELSTIYLDDIVITANATYGVNKVTKLED